MNNVFFIPVGTYFNESADACFMAYAPLKNKFFLLTPSEASKMRSQLERGEDVSVGGESLLTTEPSLPEIDTDTFVTLHILLNEKCNFHCTYCYSAQGRSNVELTFEQIEPVLRWFLSSGNKSPQKRTIMFMGGGEPTLSWSKLVSATDAAKHIAQEQGITVNFQLTTNGSIMNETMLTFLAENHFMVQVSFEVLPDVQESQRGTYKKVAKTLNRLAEFEIDHYVRATITPLNVDRIPEMVEWCHSQFPKLTKLSCQQVVDPGYFTSPSVVDAFFNRYFHSFKKGELVAKQHGLTLRSSASHLIDYSQRDRFCFNLAVLTPYGTLTTCPDVSSPNEEDYSASVFGNVKDGQVVFDYAAFERLTCGNIHYYDACKECFARWNCGSGCPSTRRVYTPEIFDAICSFYRSMLVQGLMERLATIFHQNTGKDLYETISSKLCATNNL